MARERKKGAVVRTEEFVHAMMSHNKNARLLAEVRTPGQHGVFLWRTGEDRYRVQYGECLFQSTGRADAACKFGWSVFHALECNGALGDGFISCDVCGQRVPTSKIWTKDDETLCKKCHDNKEA